MKKIIYILVGFLFLLPKVVYADMGAPLVREYEVEVINPNGAILYDVEYDNETDEKIAKETGKTVPYGYKFTIDYDEEEAGEYLSIYDSKYEGEVKRSDTRALLGDFKLDKDEKLGDSFDIIIVENVNIYEGPSYGYNKTNTVIKKDTKLKAKRILVCDNNKKCVEEDDDTWMYVEYNGTKGYISSYGGYVAFDERQEEGYACEDIKIYNDKEDVIDTIKANTYLKTSVYDLDMWSGSYYIKYNNKYVVVPKASFIIKDTEIEFTATKKSNIYELVNEDNDGNFTAKVVGTISAGTKFKSKYYNAENWAIFVRYEKGNVKGWVCVKQREYADDEEYDEDDDYYDGISFEWPYEDDIEVNPNDEEPEVISPNNSSKKLSKMEIIYICIGAAIVASLSATVTIILLNKKKKKEEK